MRYIASPGTHAPNSNQIKREREGEGIRSDAHSYAQSGTSTGVRRYRHRRRRWSPDFAFRRRAVWVGGDFPIQCTDFGNMGQWIRGIGCRFFRDRSSARERRRTAQSKFKLPIRVADESVSGSRKWSAASEFFDCMALVIWDEAPTAHRHLAERIGRSIREIRTDERPFGVVLVVLGGDF